MIRMKVMSMILIIKIDHFDTFLAVRWHQSNTMEMYRMLKC